MGSEEVMSCFDGVVKKGFIELLELKKKKKNLSCNLQTAVGNITTSIYYF